MLEDIRKIIKSRAFFYLSFILVFVVFGSLYISSYMDKSATYDEAVILYAGASALRNGDTALNSENPALGKSILALPTAFMDLKYPGNPDAARYSYSMGAGFRLARQFLYSYNDATTILFWCRMMNVLLCFAGAVFLYLFLRLWLKKGFAFTGMLLFLLSPTVIANARLATVDMAVTMFIFGCTYFMFRALTAGKTAWVFPAGVMVAGAMLSKFTGILLIPIIFLQLAVYCVFTKDRAPVKKALGFLVIIIFISLLIINSCYLFKGTYHTLAQCNVRSPMLSGIASLPFVKDIPISLPLDYIKGFDIVAYNNQPGFPNIFMGRYYPDGGSWWYYYLAAMGVKVPVPLLALFIAGIIISCGKFYRRREFYYIIIPPLLIFINFSFIACRQLGIRYILPLFPFLAIAAAMAVRYIKLRLPPVLLAAWLALANTLIFPHYLAYFNILVGGPENGRNYLVSSNLDWGQDLPGLKKWLDKKGNPPIYLFYFGQAAPEYYGIKYSSRPQYIAVSATYMYLYKANKSLPPHIRKYLENILKTEPEANIGYSIYIYKALNSKN